MQLPSFGQVWSTVTTVVTISSLVANLLPKAEVLAPYPRVQKFYQVSINFISALAINLRAQLPSLALPILGFKQPVESPQSTDAK